VFSKSRFGGPNPGSKHGLLTLETKRPLKRRRFTASRTRGPREARGWWPSNAGHYSRTECHRPDPSYLTHSCSMSTGTARKWYTVHCPCRERDGNDETTSNGYTRPQAQIRSSFRSLGPSFHPLVILFSRTTQSLFSFLYFIFSVFQ
jgi:hypothetical protein